MKKIFLILLISISLLNINKITAQTEVDAFRYSFLNPNGTARYLGMGGAYGALGADFSTLSSNPAGIALYKSNEFTFTPSFYNGTTKSDFLNNTNSDNKYNFNLGNLGLIFASKSKKNSDDTHGFKNFQFGLGINRTANFNTRYVIDGYNAKNSLMTEYLNYANNPKNNTLRPFDTQLAFDTYLIDTIPGNNKKYFSGLSNGKVEQMKAATISGSANEAVFSVGANYDERLYLGGTIGIPYFNYSENSDYSETDIYNSNNLIQGFNLNDKLDDSGVGINFKLGVIYRVADWFRLGVAVHSPSFYNVYRSHTRTINSDTYNTGSYEAQTDASFSYKYQTPAHYLGSIGFVIGKHGMIDIDYEYADFSTMKLRKGEGDYKYTSENNIIQDIYRGQNNLRIGGEIKLNPIILRAGYNYSSSPYKNDNNNERNSISLGFGFRDKNYFFDAGYMYTLYKEQSFLYDPNLVDPSNNTITNNTLSFTIGLKF